ncbi:MAG: hypothetical protein HRT37_21115 [Alteromonadaceae bacterium]|nr:hypothetical protein [Alteromonadaceae bacterium]
MDRRQRKNPPGSGNPNQFQRKGISKHAKPKKQKIKKEKKDKTMTKTMDLGYGVFITV